MIVGTDKAVYTGMDNATLSVDYNIDQQNVQIQYFCKDTDTKRLIGTTQLSRTIGFQIPDLDACSTAYVRLVTTD